MADVEPGVKSRRKPRGERLPETNDAVDIAMHAVASGKVLPDVARRLLEEQSRFVRAQTSEIRTRQVGERVRAALWAVLAITAAAIVGLIAVMLVQASRTDALVVQSFRVPPSLEAKGLTGEVVATQVLDKLAEMQEGTESVRAASTYANNWEDDLKIDIPNTGATTDQVWKLLRGWLGKETRISGEVIDLGNGLALTARVGAKPGQRFVSEQRDLDALIAQGAELIFKRTQPYRHAVYVGRIPQREIERYELLMALTSDPSPVERKWAFSGLAYDRREMGFFADAVRMAENALAIDPQLTPALGNLGVAHRLMGHDQAMVDAMAKELASGKNDQFDSRIAAANRCSSLTSSGFVLRDPVMFDEGLACLAQAPGSYSQYADSLRATAALLRGNPAPALAYRAAPKLEQAPEEDEAAMAELRLRAETLRGPSPALGQTLDAFMAARAKSEALRAYYRNSAPVNAWPLQAEAMTMLSRTDEAAELIGRTPLDCYECVRTRGLVAEAQGERRAAQLWYLAAARLGPRLPAAFADWGRLLGQAGRYESAEVKLKEAVRLAPNWADPLKSWGNMLAAQGKRAEALAKYDAALKLAPNWLALGQARARLKR